jgi:hypothetical protein
LTSGEANFNCNFVENSAVDFVILFERHKEKFLDLKIFLYTNFAQNANERAKVQYYT